MNFQKIERKWQKKWEESKIFKSSFGKKDKFYILEMFPYPSGSGLHIGHAFNYTIGDVLARYKRMKGFNVLYPMGFDAFGLPAENAAIKCKEHPKKYTNKAIKNYIKQQKSLGLSYEWDRLISTCEPEYYKWNQYFFLQLMKKGLVYRDEAYVNWCPKCKTVLANEQAQGGKCWRHEDTDVQIKKLDQWFIKITAYSEELLEFIDRLDWPERVKLMQKNWIGKSEGAEILFEINGKKYPVFTTRPDTIYGVTFLAISVQHPDLMKFVKDDKRLEVENFISDIKSVSMKVLTEKKGVFTGSYAINPINNEKVPVYASNFVLAEYGSGIVMGVPAHDQRDFDFAKKYNLKIKKVIENKESNIDERAYTGNGSLVNSENFNNIDNEKAKWLIVDYLNKKGLAKKTVQYKLKDWLVSRQRYWGTPIPVIYCNSCGIVPVDEKDLPVILPMKVKFGEGNPLSTNKKWLNTKCPKCSGRAKRETDTMDTFFDSSWYFLRFIDNKNNNKPFDKIKVKYWMPVDQYIGGVEHACMHLLYARFFTKVLRDMGFVEIDEPFKRLFNQGIVRAEDGRKMSKSLGNVINPEEVANKYGIDSARFFLLSLASADKDRDWSENGIQGSVRFLNKVFSYFKKVKKGKSSERMISFVNKKIKEISENIENFNYNIAIIQLREFFERLSEEESEEILFTFLKLFHPFCPHITEEIWERIGGKGFISLSDWPIYDESKIKKEFEKEEEIFKKLVEDIKNVLRILREKSNKELKKCFIYTIPSEKEIILDFKDYIEKKTSLGVFVFSVNEPGKYDPENKSKNVKPGKPGIYLE